MCFLFFCFRFLFYSHFLFSLVLRVFFSFLFFLSFFFLLFLFMFPFFILCRAGCKPRSGTPGELAISPTAVDRLASSGTIAFRPHLALVGANTPPVAEAGASAAQEPQATDVSAPQCPGSVVDTMLGSLKIPVGKAR